MIDGRCIRSICAEKRARSSRHRLCSITDTGIGSTIPVYNRNRVRIPSVSIDAEFRQNTLAVLYRSKEPALPDFSKTDDEVGDVFFDVRVCLRPKHSLLTP